MIDFRYHIVSIVAVFLALALGIVLGSGALGEQVPKLLRQQLANIQKTNQRLESQVSALNREVQSDRDFAIAVRNRLIPGVLSGDNIVLITYESSTGDLLDAVQESVAVAGGGISLTVTFDDKLRLDTPQDASDLAGVLGATGRPAQELPGVLGENLGAAMGSALREVSGDPTRGPQRGAASQRLDGLLSELESAGFIGVQRTNDDETLPFSPDFIIAGGSDSAPPFRLEDATVKLATELAKVAPVVGAEASTSEWGMVAALRADDITQDEVTTVDHADGPVGSIALVLGLDLAEQGSVQHLGTGPDAQSGIIPPPNPNP